MDTKRHIFVGQFMGVPYFYAVSLGNRTVSKIPTQGGYDLYRCLSVDTENETLIAIDAYTKQLNSINWYTGNFTPLMNVSTVVDKVGNGHSYDSKNKVLYALTLDFSATHSAGYANVINIIDIVNQKITNHSILCEYKVCDVNFDPSDGELYAMEYEAGWGKTLGHSQPANQTVYVGRINQQTWEFERLVSLIVPFYSNNFLTAYSSTRGYYALAWPEPDYEPYVSSSNGVLQVVDVRSKTIVYKGQVKGWSMRGKTGANQQTQLLLDLAFSD